MGSKKIIMAGNPNVGKSTLFNYFTGLKQHTGNWPGKTVGSACGYTRLGEIFLEITDTPGTYSLDAISADEENARDSILFSPADCVIVVCDACCLERSLYLALQIMEVRENLIICLNLMDQAAKKGINIDIPLLEKRLGCPVLAVSAAQERNLDSIPSAAIKARSCCRSFLSPQLRCALEPLTSYFEAYRPPLPASWLALQTLCGNDSMIKSLSTKLGLDVCDPELSEIISAVRQSLTSAGIDANKLSELHAIYLKVMAAEICKGAVISTRQDKHTADKILSRPLWAWTGMLGLLFIVLWLSIFAAEYPGQLLSTALTWFGQLIRSILIALNLPPRLTALLCDGVYRTAANVIAVMLPPMAVFFPLFSLLEDWGFLPRLAFSMDAYFQSCGGCGKQALTMCMGLGCNTVGINGCKIIGSPREKAVAMLTNSFMPCNGRFPLLISLAAYLFRDTPTPRGSFYAAISVMGLIILGAVCSLAASGLLTKTLLKGETSAFILEIPPFRRPKFLQVIKRALIDRTFFVMLRAVKFAAPAGIIIWLLANVCAENQSFLAHLSDFLEPAARLIGLDGVILLAFILGFPASEIVLPIILMGYMSSAVPAQISNYQMEVLLSAHQWDAAKTLCTMVFSLLHWPCISSLAAIKDESGKWSHVLLGATLPTVFGIMLCALIRLL